MVEVASQFLYDTDRPTFLKRELLGFGVNGYQYVRVHDHASVLMLIHAF